MVFVIYNIINHINVHAFRLENTDNLNLKTLIHTIYTYYCRSRVRECAFPYYKGTRVRKTMIRTKYRFCCPLEHVHVVWTASTDTRFHTIEYRTNDILGSF